MTASSHLPYDAEHPVQRVTGIPEYPRVGTSGHHLRPRLPWPIARLLSYLKRQVEAYDVEMWKRSFRACGRDVHISPQCSIWGFEGFSIGDHSVIHQFTHIFASGGVDIGRGVMVSSNCAIASVTHPAAAASRWTLPLVMKPVRIDDNAWIGMGAVILPGVTIGADAVVGAGAVVTRDVLPRTVVVGNPARAVRNFAI
jgi:maltose O-acetyltransferase